MTTTAAFPLPQLPQAAREVDILSCLKHIILVSVHKLSDMGYTMAIYSHNGSVSIHGLGNIVFHVSKEALF